jgi:cell division protein FtsB
MAESFSNTRRFKLWQGLLFFLLALVLGAVVYFPNYARWMKLRRENTRLSLQNQRLEEEIADLQEKIKALSSDDYFYETIARDSLGVAKEDEIVIDIEE